MKRITLLTLFLPLLLFGQDTADIPYIQNDNFATNAFGFLPTVKNFKKRYSQYFILSKKPIKNIYDKSLTDTIYSFNISKTKIEIYHAKDKDILQSAFIETNKIIFKLNIKIGDSKASVAKAFNKKTLTNTFKVGNLEQTQVYLFNFKNDKLVSVSYDGFIE